MIDIEKVVEYAKTGRTIRVTVEATIIGYKYESGSPILAVLRLPGHTRVSQSWMGSGEWIDGEEAVVSIEELTEVTDS